MQGWSLDNCVDEKSKATIEKMLLEEQYPFVSILSDILLTHCHYGLQLCTYICIRAHGVCKASKGLSLRTVQYLTSTVIVFATLRGCRVRAQIHEGLEPDRRG